MLPFFYFNMLQGKKILLGVTGSIAAYKAALLVRLLIKEGAEVQVLMTPVAAKFISPLTLSTLSHKRTLITLSENDEWNNHVLLGQWADLILVAPASANTLAKMAHGLCDNLLLAVYLSATCPVMIAPAMDEDMWHHPATISNIQQLLRNGNDLIPVETGELASGLSGEGRMSEPETIVKYLKDFLNNESKPLAGKKVLVTAGPTYEPIDPVRFIGNFSSGKMGIALADAFTAQGAQVNLILGPSYFLPKNAGVNVMKIRTAKEMLDTCLQFFPASDITIMAAAVADYRPENPAEKKIKKQEKHLEIVLEKTDDVLKELGKQKKKSQFLGGFALETDHEEANAMTKLKEKNLDVIILNSLNDKGAGFMQDTNKVTIFTGDGKKKKLPLKSKEEAAKDIVQFIINALAKTH